MDVYPPFPKERYIVDNYIDSKINKGIWDKFRSLYASFNAWLNLHSNKTLEIEKIRWFGDLDEAKNIYLLKIKSDKNFRKIVNNLLHIKVIDGRENPSPPILLEDINDFQKVMEIIYRVRCNLEHGRKSITYEWDVKLIEISYAVLKIVFSPFAEKIMAETNLKSKKLSNL